jgi:hypothetical protein
MNIHCWFKIYEERKVMMNSFKKRMKTETLMAK